MLDTLLKFIVQPCQMLQWLDMSIILRLEISCNMCRQRESLFKLLPPNPHHRPDSSGVSLTGNGYLCTFCEFVLGCVFTSKDYIAVLFQRGGKRQRKEKSWKIWGKAKAQIQKRKTMMVKRMVSNVAGRGMSAAQKLCETQEITVPLVSENRKLIEYY